MRAVIVLLLSLCYLPVAHGAGDNNSLQDGLVNPGYHEKPTWFKDSFLDIREDIDEATAADKRLILYFYQDGCPYCAKLLSDNFGEPNIAAKTQQHFDVIAINMWGDREVTDFDGQPTSEKAFAVAQKVQFTPTLLLLNEDGKVILRTNGYFAPEQFDLALNFAIGKHDRQGSFRDYYATLQAAENQQQATAELTHQLAGSLPRPLQLQSARNDSQRPLMVVVEQPDCQACNELHQDIFSRREVALSMTNLDVAQLNQFATGTLQTPDGREMAVNDWVKELDLEYTPSLLFFDAKGQEVFRSEGYLKTFHVHGAMDYVISGAYQWQPEFQRYLQHRNESLQARGFAVDLMD